MFKNGVLTINYDTWKGGIAESPYSGLGNLKNADIHSKPGALLCGRKAVLEDDTTFTDRVTDFAYDEDGDNAYAVDQDGNVYRRSSGGNWSVVEEDQLNGNLYPACFWWKGYLIASGQADIFAYDSGSDDWYTLGALINADNTHSRVFYHAQDDALYLTDGNVIASLEENVGETFDPSDSGTYTFNSSALDLVQDDQLTQTLSGYRNGVVAGCRIGTSLNRGNSADVFVFDLTSASLDPNDTKFLKGRGVWQQITQGNIIYMLVDRNYPKLYATNLSSFQKIKEFKNIDFDGDFNLFPNAMDIVDDRILMGIGSTDSDATENLGVYGLKNGALELANVVSAGEEENTIGAVEDIGENKYLIAWTNETTSEYGVDLVSDIREDNYGTVLQSPIYTVGSALQPASLQQIEVELGKNLAFGQGVRISYRERLSDSWTVIATFDYATYGEDCFMNAAANLSAISKIQLQIEMTADTSSTDTPELIQVNLF